MVWRAIPGMSAVAVDGRLPLDPRGIAPESLETVEIAWGLLKDVHHEVSVVQQDPFTFGGTFRTQWPPLVIPQPLVDRLSERSDVRSRVPRDNDEDLGDREQIAHVEQRYVDTLLVVERVGCDTDEVGGFGDLSDGALLRLGLSPRGYRRTGGINSRIARRTDRWTRCTPTRTPAP